MLPTFPIYVYLSFYHQQTEGNSSTFAQLVQKVTQNSHDVTAGWYILSLVCVRLPFSGSVWMRGGSILINNTCTRGEFYIKPVRRLTRATCCGFMCVWDGSSGLSGPDSSNKDTLGRIHKSFDQLGPSVEPKPLSQSQILQRKAFVSRRSLGLTFPPTTDTSFKNKIQIGCWTVTWLSDGYNLTTVPHSHPSRIGHHLPHRRSCSSLPGHGPHTEGRG